MTQTADERESIFDKEGTYRIIFDVVSLNKKEKSKNKGFVAKFLKEDIGRNMYDEKLWATIESFAVVGDRIYYMIRREIIYDDYEDTEEITPVFGNMKLDGSDNQTYGY